MHISFVYGLHTIGARRALWEELSGIDVALATIGDFNSVFEVGHRIGGNLVSLQEISDGTDFIVKYHINFVRSMGHYFSWHYYEDGVVGIRSRIDHYLANNKWLFQFNGAIGSYFNHGLSDYSPLLLQVSMENSGGCMPFRFLNHLAKHPPFLLVVKAIWDNSYTLSMKGIWNTLKLIKVELKKLHVT